MCHIVMWPARSTIFSHFISNTARLKKKVVEFKMCVLISSVTYFCNVSHYKKNWVRYEHRCVLVFMRSIRYSCQILMKTWIFMTFFQKIFSLQIWKFVLWELNCSMLTDRMTEMTKLIVAFRSSAQSACKLWSIEDQTYEHKR